MLKIWKQAWKKEDGVGQDIDQDSHSRGPDGDAEVLFSPSPAVPPVLDQPILGPVASETRMRASTGLKATRSAHELESVDEVDSPKRSFKRLKTEVHSDVLLSSDGISRHLPEVMDMDEARSGPASARHSSLEVNASPYNSILSHAKLENTLAIVDSDVQKLKIMSELLKWSCASERDRPFTGIARRRRVAVVVVDDVETVDFRVSQLAEQCNLNLAVYSGAVQSPAFDYWTELVYKDVVVVPAALILESLTRGMLAISQIHYMVIDDVLSIKDNSEHPMQQVMREFYRITDKLSRPKVFGFVRPPLETQFYFDVGFLKVESILDAHTYGISGSTRESIRTLPERPTELVVFYDPQVKVIDTPLSKLLRSFDPRISIYRSHFRNAKLALGEAGACACDLVWRRALKDMDADLGNDEPVYEEEDELQIGSEGAIRKTKSNMRDAIKNWLFTMPNLDPSSRGFNVTPKFAKLVQLLKACEPQGEKFRGIVFVQRRIIAYVLTDLLRTLDDHVGFLRPQTLSGQGHSSDPDAQNDVIEGFKSGLYNLLIATKYAEDLDLAQATMVIRFDVFDSHVSYAYCRSRARGQQCHLIHMAEHGSDVHRRMIARIAGQDSRMERWIQRVANSPGSAVPPYPLRETIDPYRSDSEDEDEDPAKFVKDPTTSGKIYVQDSTTAVYRFASQLQPTGDSDDLIEPLFEYEELQGSAGTKEAYICTVLLPQNSPIMRISGPPCSSMAQSRRTACHQTCIELFQRGMLDYRLFPRPPLPTSRPQRATYISAQTIEEVSDKEEDELQLPSKVKQGQNKSMGTRSYPRKGPDFWRNSLPIMRGCLYPTVITPIVDPNAGSEGSGAYAPIVLLTRLPMPPVASFKLFFSGVPAKIHITRAAAFDVDDDRLQDLHKYTIRIVRYVTNKPYICAQGDMPYFFAPLPPAIRFPLDENTADVWHRWKFPDVSEHIIWEKVRLAANRPTIPLNTQDLQTLIEDTKDAMIQDRWNEFTRRFFCVRMRSDLTPLSKPQDSPREQDFDSLVDYCKARRRGFDGLQNYKQPIVEVTRCPSVNNHLNPTSKPIADSKRPPTKYLIPELCAKCTIPASTYRTATLLPSIMRRIDDVLLVKELNAKFFDHSIAEHLLHAAVSSPSAAVEFDYERLELLGDAYLKYLSSIYLFVTFPTLHEGALHMARQRIISNRSLLRNANRCGLPQYIQSKPFLLKNWAPPSFHIYNPPRIRHDDSYSLAEAPPEEPARKPALLLEEGEVPEHEVAKEQPVEMYEELNQDATEKRSTDQSALENPRKKPSKKKRQEKETNIQWLGDKGVADVAEATIGAAYVTGGREVALKVTKALNIPVPHIDRWSDFGRKALAPPPEVTAKLRPGSIEAVEAIMGHKFNHPHLLAQALTHASIHGNEMTSYERLEFMGDAILDFLVIRHIYDRDSGLSPGALTLLKGAMVSNAALAAVCVWAGLHEHLLFESYTLANNIKDYADNLKAKQDAEYDLAVKEGRTPGQFWVEIEPPKALSDVVESILGAVYISDNFSPIGAEKFFDKVLKPFYDRHITLQTLSHHPTKILFELFQSRGCQDFELAKENISPDENGHTVECQVVVHDVILSSARDNSPTLASRMASFLALDAIEGDPGFMARACDCRIVSHAKRAARKLKKATSQNVEEVEEQVVEDVLISDAERHSQTPNMSQISDL